LGTATTTTRQLAVGLNARPADVCRALRREQDATLWLDGAGGFADRWPTGPLVALQPTTLPWTGLQGVASLDALVAARRRAGGPAETGVAALVSYDLGRGSNEPGGFELVALVVDRSLRWSPSGAALLTERGAGDRLGRIACGLPAGEAVSSAGARRVGRPATSLPRERYLRAVERVKQHIDRGDIYQANLCQRFEVGCRGDPFETYVRLTQASPAPRSAWLEVPGLSLVSLSPEMFFDARGTGEIETCPIKGTRARGSTPEADRAAAAELARSEKDRAELMMIVDLERNDLSRVCRSGTVEVPELAALRSYAAVHHLVARVRGRLAAGVGIAEILRATFPGGSISGAPKVRAMQILDELEPVRRGFFTGSLFWFGDDGSMESSILIRTWVFAGGRGRLGAGGGVVADSDPLEEWNESNQKARVLALALGFDPEEAA